MNSPNRAAHGNPSTWLAAVWLSAVLMAPAHSQLPTVAGQPLYVEWPVHAQGLGCEPLAVSPELDSAMRREQLKVATGAFVWVDGEGQLSVPRLVVNAGEGRLNKTLDALTFDRLLKCRAPAGPGDRYLDVDWDFSAATPVVVTLLAGGPAELRPARIVMADCAKPQYPGEALRNQLTGAVLLRFAVGKDGQLRDHAVARSSGHPSLDQATDAALSQCRFEPATLAGVPVNGMTMVNYVWKLAP